MPDPPRVLKYRLGRDCTLTIDGVAYKSVTDAVLRVRSVSQDAHHGGNTSGAEITIRRDLAVEFTLLDYEEAEKIDYLVSVPGSDPIVEVSVENGHVVRTFLATLHDVREQQGLSNTVASQWEVRQWGQRTTG